MDIEEELAVSAIAATIWVQGKSPRADDDWDLYSGNSLKKEGWGRTGLPDQQTDRRLVSSQRDKVSNRSESFQRPSVLKLCSLFWDWAAELSLVFCYPSYLQSLPSGLRPFSSASAKMWGEITWYIKESEIPGSGWEKRWGWRKQAGLSISLSALNFILGASNHQSAVYIRVTCGPCSAFKLLSPTQKFSFSRFRGVGVWGWVGMGLLLK